MYDKHMLIIVMNGWLDFHYHDIILKGLQKTSKQFNELFWGYGVYFYLRKNMTKFNF